MRQYLPLFAGLAVAILAGPVAVFSTDFNSGSPPGFLGITTTVDVQGYAGYGTGANVFGGSFLRNSTGDNFGNGPLPSKTTLALTGLPEHTDISIGFLLAIIDSWDGTGCFAGPDSFTVTVDGLVVFSEVFDNGGCGTQSYAPPAGVELARKVQLGFNPGNAFHLDSAYNMGLEPRFNGIAHTSETLTIEWFAGGIGWQGGTDESWAIDNVEILLNTVVHAVQIDIKPGSDPNSINPRSNGAIPVAVLTADDFDATGIDAATVLFGPGEASPSHSNEAPLGHFEDIDGDGDVDVVFHFKTRETGIACGMTEATLTGRTLDGQQIEGTDSVRTVGCK